jgi:hypothetical protein
MGDFRFYFCLPELLSCELIEEKAPDHGLIYLDGRRVRIVRSAPRRTLVDKDSEIRYLRFAIINAKQMAPDIERELPLAEGNAAYSASPDAQPKAVEPKKP